MESQVIAFLIGAGVALSAQSLGHALTLRRDRRTDFARALDKAVSAFAGGERTLDDLTDAVERGGEEPLPNAGFPQYVQDALAEAEHTRVDMRAALFSIRVRLKSPDTDVFRAFDVAFREWEMGFLKCKIIVREEPWDDVREARGHASRFRGEFYDVALERAAEAVGGMKP